MNATSATYVNSDDDDGPRLAQIAREDNHCYDLCDEGDYDEKECEEMCSEYKEAHLGGLAQM